MDKRAPTKRSAIFLSGVIVGACLALVAMAGVVFLYWGQTPSHRRFTYESRRDLTLTRQAAEIWVAEHEGGCPSVSQLIADGILDATHSRDPWIAELKIECREDWVEAISAGPDRQYGTDDDIRQ